MEKVDPSTAKMAVAIALLRRSRNSQTGDLSEDVQHWKKKVEIGSPFATLAHQSLEFIQGIKLTQLHCGTSYCDPDTQFHVQHLIRKLGVEPYIAQRILLLVAQRVCALADSLHCMDPFDSTLPNIHDSMFMTLRLMEFLVSDYAYTWITNKDSEKGLFEETLRWIVQSKKSLTLLDNRNCLYMIQLDRVIGELAKQVGRVPRTEIEKLVNMEILESMFH
ncbi:hypothetical protein EJ110_NYTH10339 [Nymphaea thermarum]|nr:hypothetical protein EJ110_NYTH10339 [Nymphaea thermarum]